MTDRQIDRAVAAYARSRPRLEVVTSTFVELLTRMLDDAGFNYLSVTGRTKTVASFAAKAHRERDGRAVHPEPMRQITDQIGVRVITYVHSDVVAIAQLFADADQLTVLEDRDMGQDTARQGRFGYASRHLLLCVGGTDAEPSYDPMRCVSVQLRTVLQHAWAEFEHEIRYKGTVPPEHAPDLDRRFTLAAGLLELADREFSVIRDTVSEGMGGRAVSADDDDPRISAQELATFLAGRYASAGWSRTEHYAWIGGLLLELGITSLDELSEVLRPVDSAWVTGQMGYRYAAGAVRRLDDDLLQRFGEQYVELHGNADRQEALTTRLTRLLTPAPAKTHL